MGSTKIVALPLPSNTSVPQLPNGVAIKGGLARNALLQLLLGRECPETRDIDLVSWGNEIDKDELDRLAEELAPDDFANGHGVELAESMEAYFAGRDLSIHEVVIRGSILFASERAIDDANGGILRIIDASNRQKLTAKCWRLSVELPSEWRIIGAAEEVGAFHLALHLDRCRSVDHAAAYCRLAMECGELPKLRGSPRMVVAAAVRFCADQLHNGVKFFRAPWISELPLEEEPIWYVAQFQATCKQASFHRPMPRRGRW